jgi:hypothetical protein
MLIDGDMTFRGVWCNGWLVAWNGKLQKVYRQGMVCHGILLVSSVTGQCRFYEVLVCFFLNCHKAL